MTSMTRRAPPHSATISEVGAIVVSPENATCSLRSERATTHPLECPPLWPGLRRPRLAGFEVSTEALVTLRCVDDARTKKFRNALRRVAEQVAEYIARVLPDAIRGGPPGVERLAIDVVRAGGHPDGTPGGV